MLGEEYRDQPYAEASLTGSGLMLVDCARSKCGWAWKTRNPDRAGRDYFRGATNK